MEPTYILLVERNDATKKSLTCSIRSRKLIAKVVKAGVTAFEARILLTKSRIPELRKSVA